jgi:hypothetical protein
MGWSVERAGGAGVLSHAYMQPPAASSRPANRGGGTAWSQNIASQLREANLLQGTEEQVKPSRTLARDNSRLPQPRCAPASSRPLADIACPSQGWSSAGTTAAPWPGSHGASIQDPIPPIHAVRPTVPRSRLLVVSPSALTSCEMARSSRCTHFLILIDPPSE